MRSLFTFMLLLAFWHSMAQEGRYKPLYNPAPAAQSIAASLFELEPAAVNHRFTAALPDHGTLIMEARRFRDFPDTTPLAAIMKIAANAYAAVADSFRSPQSVRSLHVHLPVNNELHTIRFSEDRRTDNIVVHAAGSVAPLKLGMDTVRILKNYSWPDDSRNTQYRQVQYTFLLKSIDGIRTLSGQEDLIADIAATFDSLAHRQERRRLTPNAWYVGYEAAYDPQLPEGSKGRIRTQNTSNEIGDRNLGKAVFGTVGVGMTLFRNTLAPSIDYGIGLKWPKRNYKDQYHFVMFSTSGFSLFKYETETKVVTQGATYLNVETGTIYHRSKTLLPLYQTSFGIGYLAYSGIPSLTANTLRFFLNYSLTKNVSVRPELYFPVPWRVYEEHEPVIIHFGATLRVHL